MDGKPDGEHAGVRGGVCGAVLWVGGGHVGAQAGDCGVIVRDGHPDNAGGDVGEFGATTGRPRRVGHFDCVATKYGFNLQGSHTGALTCLDVLGYMDEIKVCTAYEIDDGQTTDFPTTAALYKALPIYETLPGWKCDIRGQKDFDKLPQQAKDYIAFLEARIEAKFKYISTGPRREETIVR